MEKEISDEEILEAFERLKMLRKLEKALIELLLIGIQDLIS